MRLVKTLNCHPLFSRGAVASRIVTFTLSQLGLDEERFRLRFGRAVRNAPFDPYDPALAAEEAIRGHDPGLYERHEPAWLHCWSSLHKEPCHGVDSATGANFWRERIPEQHPLRSVLRELRPYRQRCCRRYKVSASSAPYSWRIIDLGVPVFTQAVADVRSRARHFASLPDNLIYDEALLTLLATACELASNGPEADALSFEVTVHLMLTHADVQGRKPAPEGMHQDGADYIVSATVLERCNVSGGASVISLAGPGGPPAIDSIVLKEGQGLFQADAGADLWHGVMPVKPLRQELPAYRSILGLDITHSLGAVR